MSRVAARGPRTLGGAGRSGDTRGMTARWIVGIDGSDAATDALRWAVGHAGVRGASVTALGAYHVPTLMSVFAAKRGFGVDELGLAATAGHDVDAAIEAAASSAATDPPVIEASVLEGQAQHVLVDASADAALLVLGRTGSGGLRHQLLGSVSQYCVTHAASPVAVVPPGCAERVAATIAVGFDGSDHAAAALRWALEFAGADVQVRAIAAIEVAAWMDGDVSRDRFADDLELEKQRIIEALDVVDVDGRAERSIVLGSAREALADAQATADLMVVGTRGHGRLTAGLLGSVSTWLLHDADVPVVIVPDH
jgi:nucleotide-binding universal stress UspA family protein